MQHLPGTNAAANCGAIVAARDWTLNVAFVPCITQTTAAGEHWWVSQPARSTHPTCCAGKCGNYVDNCYCDTACCDFGDCCPDVYFNLACGGCQRN